MKKTSFICLLSFLLIMTFISYSHSQTITYSESFTNGSYYCPGSTQYDNWITFRSQLDIGTHYFTRVTMSGTYDSTGISCTDPTVVNQIADSLEKGSYGNWSCDGHTWQIGSCYAGACGSIDNDISLAIDIGACDCVSAGYRVTPGVTNTAWGGVNTGTCYQYLGDNLTQTMTVIFEYGSPCDQEFCYDITYTNLDNPEDIKVALTNFCFNFEEHSGKFGTWNLSLFFDSMNKQALAYGVSAGLPVAYLKFHGDQLNVVKGIYNFYGIRWQIRGHKVASESCPGL